MVLLVVSAKPVRAELVFRGRPAVGLPRKYRGLASKVLEQNLPEWESAVEGRRLPARPGRVARLLTGRIVGGQLDGEGATMKSPCNSFNFSCSLAERSHLDTATKAREWPKGTDREPSSARSAFDRGTGVESARASNRVRGCCEPRTARGAVVVSRCAVAALFALALFPSVARAHVGSPNVFFEGQAGPFPVHVIIKPAEVIPGLAEITVRVEGSGIERVTALPIKWNAGRKGAPPPEVAQRVRGETNLFNAQLWFMEGGAQSVE